jgi:CBS domain containing-hemolysin-like protein
MGPIVWLVVPGVLVFAGASFFFALAESALFALGKWRAKQIAGQPGGATVLSLLERPAELLATIVLGNITSNGAIVALVLWPVLLGQWPAELTLPAVAIFILVGCEILPKTLAVRSPELWSRQVAQPIFLLRETTGWLQRLFQRFNEGLLRMLVRGAIRPQSSLAEAEYQELVELAFQQGTLAKSEKEIILQIVNLDRKTAKDVMKPRSRMAAISDELSIEEMISAARKFKHRRLPIYDETPDTIVGILNTRALLLDPNIDLAEAIEFPSFVPESMNLLQLLKSLQRQQRGLGIVVDEFGGTAGLVTVEDIMEEVVGQIREEGEPAGFVMEKMADGRWRVSGRMRIDDFRREYAEIGEVPEVDTMGGLMVWLAEVVPAMGESVTFRGLKLTAQWVEERRVRELVVETVKRK